MIQPVSEARSIAGSRALYTTQREMTAALKAMYGRMAADIAAFVSRSAQNGVVPRRLADEVSDRGGEIAARYFALGRRVFDEQNRALTPYAALLNRHYVLVTRRAVRPHADMLRKRLPDDVLRWLQAARPPAPPARETWTNPLVNYDPMHLWVDPSGYTLSDRIWRASTDVRTRIDALLTAAIRSGTGSLGISRQLEQFLVPGQALRTSRPYGRDASFSGMRLARSEITRAHSVATLAASRANPYVDQMSYRLSPRHPKFDICDGFAARSPYPIDQCPIPVMDTHPQCICSIAPLVTSTPAQVTTDLQASLQGGNPAPFTPAAYDAFLTMLLGSVLLNLVGED